MQACSLSQLKHEMHKVRVHLVAPAQALVTLESALKSGFVA